METNINDQIEIDLTDDQILDLTIGAQGSNYVFNTATMTHGTGSYIYPTTWSDNSPSISGKTLLINGNSEFNGDVKIKGRSLIDFMNSLEQRLNILQPNPAMEAEWDQLRELGDRYRELEQQCKEKSDMWTKLKEIKK
jgi:hypothetical protein